MELKTMTEINESLNKLRPSIKFEPNYIDGKLMNVGHISHDLTENLKNSNNWNK